MYRVGFGLLTLAVPLLNGAARPTIERGKLLQLFHHPH
jgi:hypothetical protein